MPVLILGDVSVGNSMARKCDAYGMLRLDPDGIRCLCDSAHCGCCEAGEVSSREGLEAGNRLVCTREALFLLDAFYPVCLTPLAALIL